MPYFLKIWSWAEEYLKDVIGVIYTLFKILIPVIIVVKILKELGFIHYLSMVLSPVMNLAGLPGEMGLVWATAIVTNLYAGAMVFLSLIPHIDLNIAQITVLTTMMLIAHNLPVELKVTKEAGAGVFWIGSLRVLSALLLGIILFHIYRIGGWLQDAGLIPLGIELVDDSFKGWLSSQLKNLTLISLVISFIILIMRVLERIGVINIITSMLEPVLKIVGIKKASIPVVIVGLTLGIAYGGGLIIEEAKKGNIEREEIWASLSFMSLSHALIEDTLLMMVIGGHLSGILFARLVYTFIVLYLVLKIKGKAVI